MALGMAIEGPMGSFDHQVNKFEYPDGSKLSSQCRQVHGCWNSHRIQKAQRDKETQP